MYLAIHTASKAQTLHLKSTQSAYYTPLHSLLYMSLIHFPRTQHLKKVTLCSYLTIHTSSYSASVLYINFHSSPTCSVILQHLRNK